MLRVPVDGLSEGVITLDPEASRYITRVHRKKAGERCLLFDPALAIEAEATILEVHRDKVACQVDAPRPSSMRPRRSVSLLQAIGKGEKLDSVVRDATELSVTEIVAIESARTVVQLGNRAPARLERWRRIAIEAARQCGRGDAPTVRGPLAWSEVIAEHADSDALKLCCWERATEPLGPHLKGLDPARPVVFAIGPEGGLEEAEIEEARRAGFHIVSLGPLTLRTETVAAAVLGAVLLCGDSASSAAESE